MNLSSYDRPLLYNAIQREGIKTLLLFINCYFILQTRGGGAPTALVNKIRPPQGTVNLERSQEICRTVMQKSSNATLIQQNISTLKPVPCLPVGTVVTGVQNSVTSSSGVTLVAPPEKSIAAVRPAAPSQIVRQIRPIVTAATPTSTIVRLPTVPASPTQIVPAQPTILPGNLQLLPSQPNQVVRSGTQIISSLPQQPVSIPSFVLGNASPQKVMQTVVSTGSVPTVSVTSTGVFRVPTPSNGTAATVVVEASGMSGQPSTRLLPIQQQPGARLVYTPQPVSGTMHLAEQTRPQVVIRQAGQRSKIVLPQQPTAPSQSAIVRVDRPASIPTSLSLPQVPVPIAQAISPASSPSPSLISRTTTPSPQQIVINKSSASPGPRAQMPALPNQPVAVSQLPELFQRPRPPGPGNPIRVVAPTSPNVIRTILIPSGQHQIRQVNQQGSSSTQLPAVQLPSEPVPTALLGSTSSTTTFTAPKRPTSIGTSMGGRLFLKEDGTIVKENADSARTIVQQVDGQKVIIKVILTNIS